MAVLTREASGITAPGIIADVVGSSDYQKAFGQITSFMNHDNTSLYYVALKALSTMTKVTQTWTSERNNQFATLAQIKLPRYLLTSYYEGDTIEEGVFNKQVNGISFRNVLDKLCIQGINQKIRYGALYGFQAGQGLLAFGSSYNWPDESGNNTLSTYSAVFIRNKLVDMVRKLINDVKNNTDRVVIFSSRRIINHIESEFVGLLEGQKPGAGIDTIGGSIRRVIKEGLGVDCDFILDDTLENADSTGTKDTLAVIATGFKQEVRAEKNSTGDLNIVANDNNTIGYNTTMDIGNGGKTTEQANPVINQRFSGLHFAVMSPGFALRDEAVIKASIKYA